MSAYACMQILVLVLAAASAYCSGHLRGSERASKHREYLTAENACLRKALDAAVATKGDR